MKPVITLVLLAACTVSSPVLVSRYSNLFAGKKTASGEPYNPKQHTAAHLKLPFGTCVRLTDPRSGRSTTVRVNDRGPWIKGRVFDLSEAAAKDLNLTGIKRVLSKVVPSSECAVQ